MKRVFISFVFGCLTATAALMLFLFGGVIYFRLLTEQKGPDAIGWDPIAVEPARWLLLLPFFALGFWLTYRRQPTSE